jgi:nitric oxide reductase activation protein
MGRQDLFKAQIIKEDKPLDVCLLVDESGSMGGLMQYARQSCISMKEALKDNDMLNLWVMGHTADGLNWHTDPNSTNMTVYHSPVIKDRPMAIGAMTAKCENRDGNAILAAAGKVKEETDNPMSNKLMIIFSDGSPAALGYGGSSGIAHVKKVVKGLEGSGWSIIQVGFGGAHYQEQMFTNHIYVNNIDELGDKVSKILKKVIKI